MRRASAILKETQQITTVQDLTGVFESIASTQVAKIKSKVELSKEFFDLLWTLYSSLRIHPKERVRHDVDAKLIDRNVFVIISAEAGLSGDIDQRLIATMLESYHPETTDIVVIGSHGAAQLEQRGIPFVRYFRLAESDTYIDVSPVIEAIRFYGKITLFYEEYVSLGVQGIKTLDLISSMQEMTKDADPEDDVMTAQDTIFEPSIGEIADIMEVSMMALAFSQAILESSLAQDASRFNAMAQAKKRAWELLNYYRLDYHRAKRSESDRRLREVMVSLKKKKHAKDKK